MPYTASAAPNSAEFDVGSAPLMASANNRQKRVMPSRSRRGPGLGQCEVDNLILETQRRKLENEPLIPGDTQFLLTTNPKYAQEPLEESTLGIKINIVANDRYFDRPEVLKAFREQTTIQTPAFEHISESMSGVGGRFRPRNQEEAVAETSDAAYEKRHRKFENFEKRQRLREKDKLKHEHYKLKERMEQLRGMDGAAFMTLPASTFSPPPPVEEDAEESLSNPFPAMNGGIYHPEGERRRKEMLDIALKLEQRYAYLLQPERPRKGQEVSCSRETESRDESDEDSLTVSRKDGVPKLRMQSARSSASSSSAPSPATSKSIVQRKQWVGSTFEPPQPPQPASDLQRNSTPQVAELEQPPEDLPEPLSPTTEIDVESHEIPPPVHFQPPPPPPLPSRYIWHIHSDVHKPSVSVTSLPLPQLQRSPSPPAVTWPLHDENMSISPSETQVPDEQVDEAAPVQAPLPPDDHIDIDGDSMKTPSDTEDIPQERRSPSCTKSATTADDKVEGQEPPQELPQSAIEVPIEPAEIVTTPAAKGDDPSIAAHQDVPVKRRGWRSRNLTEEIVTEQSEIRDVYMPLRDTIAGPSNRVEDGGRHPDDVHEETPVAEVTDSISTRPYKRRRRNKELLAQSASAQASAQLSDKGSAPISTTAGSVRGKTFVTYVDSRTGETVFTTSLLMITCVRAAEKFNTRKPRESTSFGVSTPDFGKGEIVDYELQESILYRHLRDKSQTTGPESSIEQQPARDVVCEVRDQEGLVEDDGGSQHGGDRVDDATEPTEEEVDIERRDDEPIPPRGPSVRDEQEAAMEAAERRPSPPPPQQQMDARRPIMLSPEPEPEPDLHIEAHPGVRPREPSRHIAEDELEW